ncbi:MAG: tetratricopeptide repeat protein [Pseudomonadota bacterium]
MTQTISKTFKLQALAVCASALIAATVFATPSKATETPVTDIFDERSTLSGNYLAALIAGGARDNHAAADFFIRALEDDPSNPYLIERAMLATLADGRLELAQGYAEDLIVDRPSNRTARFALALRDLRAREFTAVQRHMQAVQSGTLADLTAGLIESWALAGQGKKEEALNAVDRLQGPEWYAFFKHFSRGLMLDVLEDAEAAEASIQSAYEMESSTVRIIESKARLAARAGRTDEALEVLNAFDRVVPNQPDMVVLREAIEAGEPIERMVSDAASGAGEVMMAIGMALGREGSEDLSILYLQLALSVQENQPLALVTLADTFERLEKYQDAIDAYERIPQESPLKRASEIKRALNLDALERTDEAVSILQPLITDRPDDFEAIIALGNIFRARERYTESYETYTLAISQLPKPDVRYWTLYYYRGIAYERAKRWPLAEVDLQQALTLSPDHPLVLNYLGYSWIDQGLNLDEGMEMIRKAVRERPNDGYIVDSLGWAYYRLGEYENAVKHLERAVELRPQDPIINDHLGDAYWKVGRFLEARFKWSHARDLDPEPDELEKILVKLENGLIGDAAPLDRGDDQDG